MVDATQPEPATGLRLIFEYSGNDIRLVLQQPVDVAVDSFDQHPDVRPGDYLEVRDAAGKMLSRVPVRMGMTGSAEVFPEDHGQPITRIDKPDPHGAFTVVAPASPVAKRVAVVRITAPEGAATTRAAAGPATPAVVAAAVTELASFTLDAK